MRISLNPLTIFCYVLCALLIYGKLTNAITISWFFVTLPILWPVYALIIITIFYAFFYYIEKIGKK